MNNSSDTRSAIAEALQDKLFVEFAAKQTGTFLRNAVARHLSERRVDVVVVAASGIGNQTPCRGRDRLAAAAWWRVRASTRELGGRRKYPGLSGDQRDDPRYDRLPPLP